MEHHRDHDNRYYPTTLSQSVPVSHRTPGQGLCRLAAGPLDTFQPFAICPPCPASTPFQGALRPARVTSATVSPRNSIPSWLSLFFPRKNTRQRGIETRLRSELTSAYSRLASVKNSRAEECIHRSHNVCESQQYEMIQSKGIL